MNAAGGPVTDRRTFFAGLLKGAGATALCGLAWTGFIDGKTSYPLILRPPGAVSEEAFLALCTKCGLCAGACPYGALILARPGDERPLGTPYFVMRDNPCRMCRDIPCTVACPTGALVTSLVTDQGADGRRRLNVNLARIGLAVIDRETCVAHWGIQCDACYRACPVMDRAITIEQTRNVRTGKHAILVPVIHSDHCTGCGLCERACITKKASVFILPRQIAMGESSTRYIRGWESADEERMQDVPEEAEIVTPRSSQKPLDYLNKGDL